MTQVGAGQVSLPMYPFAELRDEWALLWSAVRDAHERRDELPRDLVWSDDIHSLWNAPDLVLSQSCGWPIVSELEGKVRVIGVFDPDVDGGEDGTYRTLLVARDGAPVDAFVGTTAAANGPDSLSGWVSLVAAVEGPGARLAGRGALDRRARRQPRRGAIRRGRHRLDRPRLVRPARRHRPARTSRDCTSSGSARGWRACR